MIKSMTGFGKAQAISERMNVNFEIRSVNHRYFEFSSRVPRSFGFLDDKLKNYIHQYVSRGKVEVNVFIDIKKSENVVVSVNSTLAQGMIQAFEQLEREYGLKNDATVSLLARTPDLLNVTQGELNEDETWKQVKSAADKALEAFCQMRQIEGETLHADVLNRLNTIEEQVEEIEKRSPQTVEEYRTKLTERMMSILSDTTVDEGRILTEAAIFADKVAVDEETVRLHSHIEQMRQFMDAEGPIGKKADFLIQEFNREANTIGSKCQDIDISKRVITIKGEIEKIREQIQNIE